LLWRVDGVELLVDGVERLLMRMDECCGAARGTRANKTALGRGPGRAALWNPHGRRGRKPGGSGRVAPRIVASRGIWTPAAPG